VHRFGQIVWALNSVSLVRDSDNNPVHFIFQIQDITERKRQRQPYKVFHSSTN